MKDCPLCKERETEIKRILKSYKHDKKVYRIVILSLFVLELFTLAFGSKGLLMIKDIILEVIK